MSWQQIVMIIWIAMGIGIGIVQHGKPKQGYYNIWIDLISTTLMVYVLWSGGFWN